MECDGYFYFELYPENIVCKEPCLVIHFYMLNAYSVASA